MNIYRSTRGWLAGLVAAFLWLLTEIGLQVIRRVFEDQVNRAVNDDSFLAIFASRQLTLFGPRPLQWARHDGWILAALVLSVVVAIVIVGLITALAARGAAPGSSVFPLFLSTWFSTVIASSLAAAIYSRVVNREIYDVEHSFGAQQVLDSLKTGALHGLQFGIFVALVTAVAWLIIRPRPAAAPLVPSAPSNPYGARSGDQYASPASSRPDDAPVVDEPTRPIEGDQPR
ncbi:hypothetical protein [Nocardioides jensenii]|uniref:hypothetical protein n=1 Tax=Nocardioides jensenii TaxID=1843 RepID=UPI0008332CE6|nr:hypothetical protein [Nocardioides jensenii]